jgi:hypothetical protein
MDTRLADTAALYTTPWSELVRERFAPRRASAGKRVAADEADEQRQRREVLVEAMRRKSS